MLTIILRGKDCVIENEKMFSDAGKRVAIVTGKNSARISGALDDVVKVLVKNNSEYVIVDNVENNPDLKNIKEAANIAKSIKPYYIIAIGGGSPLDAAKAVAVICTNDIEPNELFNGNFPNDPLLIFAIPITAGTGSEVTPYSVLTVEEDETKKSFSDNRVFPKYAFLDHKYTRSLNRDITIDTALDSFSHAFEGYISKRATRISNILAIESMKVFFNNYEDIFNFNMSDKTREELLYASTLSGIVISQTGTTVLHSVGYALTYNKGLSHGRANGLLFPKYIEELYRENKEKLEGLCRFLGIDDISEIIEKIRSLFPEKIVLKEDELFKFTQDTLKQKSVKFTPLNIDYDKIYRIFKSLG